MTRGQIKKLKTIISKVEALQRECVITREADKMGEAKSKLLDVLSLLIHHAS